MSLLPSNGARCWDPEAESRPLLVDLAGGGGLDASLCKEMGMIPDPELLILAPHAPTGLSNPMRSPRAEEK